MNKLRVIFIITIPLTGLILILLSITDLFVERANAALSHIGAALIAAACVLVFERYIVGDPLDRFYDKLGILLESKAIGLERIIEKRNTYVVSDEFINILTNAKDIYMQGMVLSFIYDNAKVMESLTKFLNNKGDLKVIVSHPNSEVFKQRDIEEGWEGGLKDRLRTTMNVLLRLKNQYDGNVKILMFHGDTHNMIISTDTHIIINNYIFGNNPWQVPVFVFSKHNTDIVNSYSGQYERIIAYGAKKEDSLIEIKNRTDMENAFK